MTLSAEERARLLSAPEITVRYRIQVLTPDLEVVEEDIAGRVSRLEIEHDSYGDVNRIVRLSTDLPLEWGFHHLRTWVSVTDGTLWDEQLLGTFALTAAPLARGSEKPEFTVQGHDLLYRLKHQCLGFTAPRDRSYLESVGVICAQQGLQFRVPPRDAPTDAPTVPRSWTITDGVTWLDIANELLAAVGFQPLACDRQGVASSEPYVQPSVRPIAWTYDAVSPGSHVVANEGEVEHDYTTAPNQWVAYRTDLDAGAPVVGNGIAVVDNVSEGPTSQLRRGVVISRVEQVDAVDQQALEAAALRMRDEDGVVPRTLRLVTKPNIWHRHLDVCEVIDPQTDTHGRMEQLSWHLTIDRESASTSHEFREVN